MVGNRFFSEKRKYFITFKCVQTISILNFVPKKKKKKKKISSKYFLYITRKKSLQIVYNHVTVCKQMIDIDRIIHVR